MRFDSDKKMYLTVGIITVIGFLLRIYKLSYQSMWFDETFSVYYSQQSLRSIMALEDTSTFLYYLILHFWIQIVGNSEFAVRLLSVFFGTALIVMIFILSSYIFNRKVGLVSGILIAISPLHIYFSQETRMYSLFFMLSLLSIYFYLRLNDIYSKFFIFGYFISTVLLVYTHMYGLLIVLAQNLHELWFNKKKDFQKISKWIILQSLTFILYVPWIIITLTTSQKSRAWIPRPNLLELCSLIYHFFSGMVFSFPGLFLTLLLLALLFTYKFKRQKNISVLFFIWIFFPIFIPFIFSVLVTPIFTIKYVLFMSLPLFILVSKSICDLKKTKQRVIFSLIVILSVLALNVQQHTIVKDPWNKVSEYIKSSDVKVDKIIIIDSYELLPFSYYFNHDCFNSKEIYSCSIIEGIYPINSIREVKKIHDAKILLILSRVTYNTEAQEILNYFEKNYTEEISKKYLLNQNSEFYNRFYNFLESRNLISLQLNVIELKYLNRVAE